MSMIGNYVRVAPETLQSLRSSPESVVDLLHPEEGDGPSGHIDVDKAWDAIGFLLTGGNEQPAALFNVVLGGQILGDEDVGYGPARYLTPAEVADSSSALMEVSPEELWSRYDPDVLNAADIYPGTWSRENDDREYILPYYDDLRKHFVEAAGAGEGMLLYLD